MNIKMFMAASFCAYVRKMTTLEIMPLLSFSNEQIQQSFFNNVKSVADMMNIKLIINKQQSLGIDQELHTIEQDNAIIEQSRKEIENGVIDDWSVFMPIFK